MITAKRVKVRKYIYRILLDVLVSIRIFMHILSSLYGMYQLCRSWSLVMVNGVFCVLMQIHSSYFYFLRAKQVFVDVKKRAANASRVEKAWADFKPGLLAGQTGQADQTKWNIFTFSAFKLQKCAGKRHCGMQ